MQGSEARVFRSVVGRWFGVIWLVFAVANLVDLLVRGDGRAALVIGAVLLAATAVVWVTALRPRIVADDGGLRVVNPVREVRVPWAAVTAIDATDVVRVHTPAATYRCWAVQALNRHRTHPFGRRSPESSERKRTTTGGPDQETRRRTARRTRADHVAGELDAVWWKLCGNGEDDAEAVSWSSAALGALGAGAALVLVATIVPL